MFASASSFGLHGIDACRITAEADLARGLPGFEIVGLPDAAVKEARDRVRSAARNSGVPLYGGRIIVNLAPADRKKAGSVYDLAILCAILRAQNMTDAPTEEIGFLGELSLDGEVRGVNGVLPMILDAASQTPPLREIIIPAENAAEGAVVEGIPVYAAKTLGEILAHLNGKSRLPLCRDVAVPAPQGESFLPDLADVRGQHAAKRALTIAAAGMHNILLIGPPGSGKSMLAKRLPGIMPPMTLSEQIETTKIFSVSALLPQGVGLLHERPFRSPHYTVSAAALTGGGSVPKPGEISLANNGVLFLDELPEFNRSAIEGMRQPLEDGCVTIARAAARITYPSHCMLVAAMNPCPCGYYGHPTHECTCGAKTISRYLGRVSGPLLDRIDLHVEVPPVPYESLSGAGNEESSATVRARVIAARERQNERYAGLSAITANALLPRTYLNQFCPMTEAGEHLLSMAFDRLGLSARGYDRILRVARTIADLDGEDTITEAHLSEAIQYRTLDRKYWNR